MESKYSSHYKVFLLVIVLILGIGLDQLSKYLISHTMSKYTVVPIIPGFFNLVHVYNRGAAFGFLSSWSPDFVRFFFIGTNLVIAMVLGYLYWRTSTENFVFLWSYSLILSGALGNLIDRVRYGEVLDFLDIYIGRHHWPAFNVADSLICLGAGLLVLAMWRLEGDKDASYPV